MFLLSILHSFNINGVLRQNLSFLTFFRSLYPEIKILVAAPDDRDGRFLYQENNIDYITFKGAENLLQKLSDRGFVPNCILIESLFALQNDISSKFQIRPVVRIHEELPLNSSFPHLWHCDYQSPEDYFKSLHNSELIFVSQHTQDHYIDYLNKYSLKSEVIYNALNEELMAPALNILDEKQEDFTILQLGTVYERKGNLNTLKAFKAFLERNRNAQNIKLMFCGARYASKDEISYIDRTYEYIYQNGLADHVSVLPTHMNPFTHIARSSMLTLHSRSESFPLVILEGMYFGKPAVCSRVGGVGEQIQEGFNGYLFEEGDTKGQAECFQKIYSNRESWIAKTNDIRGYYLNHFNSKKLNQKLSDIVMNQIQTRQKHES